MGREWAASGDGCMGSRGALVLPPPTYTLDRLRWRTMARLEAYYTLHPLRGICTQLWVHRSAPVAFARCTRARPGQAFQQDRPPSVALTTS